MVFRFEVPNVSGGSTSIDLAEGSSTFFVGANGSGKTRLAAQAEVQFGERAHRISAHRSLRLNPAVAKISESRALAGLRYGYADVRDGQGPAHRLGHRWGEKAETYLLDDFDYLLQALFADQSNIALKTHNSHHTGTLGDPSLTKFQKLNGIWDRVLPHRCLNITGDDIEVSAGKDSSYSGSDMSDGERAIFYMIGQVMVAQQDSLLIFDEPELHVHRAILGRLWDEVEVARPDCAFLIITHDLEFAASRPGSKFVIRSYRVPGQWEIEQVPEDTGFNEDVATLILGSRRPILFVEGTGASLDLAVYRACYPDWTVLPCGSCENVIHAVATMRRNPSLTRITCSGIVDSDDYSEEDKNRLRDIGVSVLPVSEIENIFLMPVVSSAILQDERFEGDALRGRLTSLSDAILAEVSRPGSINEVVIRYCRRRIDRTLKKIDLSDASTVEELSNFYSEKTSSLDISVLDLDMRNRIESAIRESDILSLLANFDNKALLALAARYLRNTSASDFKSWITRALGDHERTAIRAALDVVLPKVEPF